MTRHLLAYAGIAVLAASSIITAAAAGDRSPNFVFILADDMGWTGLSRPVDGNRPNSRSDYYLTPHLNKLAAQGLSFSNAYAPSPMCSPSRASFLTGKSPAQLHITTPGPVMKAASWMKVIPPSHVNSLPETETTLAEVLKEKGYATAHYGKWHLSGGGPGRHGFDEHDGDTSNKGPGIYDDPNPKDIFGITERAVAFMKKQAKAKKPFYLQLSHYALHSPSKYLASSKATFDAAAKGRYHTDSELAAMAMDLDTSVGQVLAQITALGLDENTYVIFMSDNGAGSRPGNSANAPLAGGKGSLLEGGIRVPLIIRGPGVKANAYCDASTVGYDLFPTICQLAGIRKAAPAGVEGTSLVPLFDKPGNKNALKRKFPELVFHYPHFGQGPKQSPQSSIRVGDMKLIKSYLTGEVQLFDLSKDIGESNDLAKQRPKEADRLHKQLNAYLKRVDAQLPTTNADYDSKAERPSRNKGGKGGKGGKNGEGGKRGARFLERFDKNKDGSVSRKEFAGPAKRFDRLDADGDGVITEEEASRGNGRRQK